MILPLAELTGDHDSFRVAEVARSRRFRFAAKTERHRPLARVFHPRRRRPRFFDTSLSACISAASAEPYC
jgi:hypothetical protein